MTIRYILLLSIGLLLSSCNRQQYVYVSDIDTDYIRVNKYAANGDSEIEAMIAPYKAKLDAEMNEVLAIVASDMTKDRPSSTLGNWFADVLQAIAVQSDPEVAFSAQNYGGLRVPSVAAGDLTVGDIYEIMPFDNTLVILTLDGSTMMQLLDRIADYGGWPVSDELSFTIKDDKATDIMIKGEPFDKNKKYKVALPDYTANGGDRCFFLKGIPQEGTGRMIRDLVVDYLRERDSSTPIEAPNTQRIQ